MSPSLHLPSLLVLIPLLASLGVRRLPSAASARAVGVGVAVVLLAISGILLGAFHADDAAVQLEDAAIHLPFLGMEWDLGLDGLSVAWPPFTAFILLALLLGLPRKDLSQREVSRLLFVVGSTLGVFCAQDLALLWVFWVLRLLPAVRAPGPTGARAPRRSWAFFMVGGTLPLLPLVAAVGWFGHQSGVERPFHMGELAARGLPANLELPLFLLVVLTVAIRMGVTPFHGWLPRMLQDGPVATGTLLVGVQVPLYFMARVAIPLFPHVSIAGMSMLAASGLVSALFGSITALVQQDLRRKIGFMSVAQSGLMMVGISSLNTESVNGALLQSMAWGASLTGMMLMVHALLARTGTARLEDLGGVVLRSPRMAAFFLILGLAAVGLPGGLGFVGEDLLVHGVLHAHPWVATVMLLASAINAITLLHAFQRVFLGPLALPWSGMDPQPLPDLLPRERAAALVLCAMLFVSGVLPDPVIQVQHTAVDALVAQGAPHGSHAEHE